MNDNIDTLREGLQEMAERLTRLLDGYEDKVFGSTGLYALDCMEKVRRNLRTIESDLNEAAYLVEETQDLIGDEIYERQLSNE